MLLQLCLSGMASSAALCVVFFVGWLFFPAAPAVSEGSAAVGSSQQAQLYSSLPSLVSLLLHGTPPVQM